MLSQPPTIDQTARVRKKRLDYAQGHDKLTFLGHVNNSPKLLGETQMEGTIHQIWPLPQIVRDVEKCLIFAYYYFLTIFF